MSSDLKIKISNSVKKNWKKARSEAIKPQYIKEIGPEQNRICIWCGSDLLKHIKRNTCCRGCRIAYQNSKYIEHKNKIGNGVCIICNITFIRTTFSKRCTCSKDCQNQLNSLNRSKFVAKHGSFNSVTRDPNFKYKGHCIPVDSKLEKAAIEYLFDVILVDKIERFRSILSFTDAEGKTRRFNPDFYVSKGNERFVVEVKMRWSKSSNHNYFKYLVQKKQRLEDFCKEKKLKFLWVDFETTPQLRSIYKKILKSQVAD